jgi:type IX secretion system PorP/SprF family membrane protein
MTLRTLLLLAVMGHAYLASAQQLPQYSLWLLNPYGYNPAAAGSEPSLVINALYRQQWVDLDGAPTTQQINAHLPIYFLRSGVGIRMENQTIGAHRTTQALISYSYQMDIGRSGTLYIGVGGGYQQYSLDGTRLRTPQGDYGQGTLQHNDQFLPLGRISIGAPVLEAGVLYRSERWLASVSALPVFMPVLEESGGGRFRMTPQRHYVASLAYTLKWGDDLQLQPGALLKADPAVQQIELSAVAHWRERLAAGVAWRGLGADQRDAAMVLFGTRLSDKIMLYYTYDIPMSGLKAVQRGSHEVMLRYNFQQPIGAGKLPPVIYNPRFM